MGSSSWFIFSISKTIHYRIQPPKETVVKIINSAIAQQSPSSSRIIEIEGIGSQYAKKLNSIDIKTTEDLLKNSGTKQAREDLAKKQGFLKQ